MRGRRTDRNLRSDQLTSSAHLLRKWVRLGSRESTRKSRAARSIGRACSTASVASQPDFLVSLSGEIKCAFGALDFLPTSYIITIFLSNVMCFLVIWGKKFMEDSSIISWYFNCLYFTQ